MLTTTVTNKSNDTTFAFFAELRFEQVNSGWSIFVVLLVYSVIPNVYFLVLFGHFKYFTRSFV